MNKAIVKVGKNEGEVEIISQDENGYEVRGQKGGRPGTARRTG